MSLRKVLKNSVYSALLCVQPSLGKRASILMYHSVGRNESFFTVTPEAFERQLQYIVAKKFTVLQITDLIARLETGESVANTVCLTFDDGYVDNYEIVFPLIKKYNLPISIFLSTGFIGKTLANSRNKYELPILSEAQIHEMNKSGFVEFLPHGAHHKKLYSLSYEDATREVTASAEVITTLTGKQPSVFAYPAGYYTAETIKILLEQGFVAAVDVKPGLVSSLKNPYELPRNPVDSSTSFVQFRAMLSGAIELYTHLR